MWLIAYRYRKLKKMPNPRWNILCRFSFSSRTFFFFSVFFFSVKFVFENAKTHSVFVNVIMTVLLSIFFWHADEFAILWKDKHTQEQNYVRRSSGNKIRLNLSDTYRGLWRQIAKNIFTVFWIWMMAVARNSIFFITEIKQRWMQLTTTITAILSSDWKAFSGGSRGRAWGGRPPYFGRKKKK